LACLNYGKRVTKIEALKCLCCLLFKFGRVDYETSTFTVLINSFKKATGDEELMALCVTVFSHYAKLAKYLEHLKSLEGFVTAVLESVRLKPLEMESEFFAKYCQRPILSLLKKLSETDKASLLEKGILLYIASGLQSEQADIRADCLDLLQLYLSEDDVADLKMMLKHLLFVLEDKEENVVLKAILCIQRMIKKSVLANVLIDNDGILSLMRLLTSSNNELIVEVANTLIPLIEGEDTRDIFVQNDGLTFILPFLVLPYIKHRCVEMKD